jgi:hypothetical protein
MEVILKWLTQKKLYSAPIAARLSPSRWKNRNFTLPSSSPMNPSVALIADAPGKQNGMVEVAEATATEVPARCIPLPADNAARRQRFLFSLAATSRFSAEIATPRADSKN